MVRKRSVKVTRIPVIRTDYIEGYDDKSNIMSSSLTDKEEYIRTFAATSEADDVISQDDHSYIRTEEDAKFSDRDLDDEIYTYGKEKVHKHIKPKVPSKSRHEFEGIPSKSRHEFEDVASFIDLSGTYSYDDIALSRAHEIGSPNDQRVLHVLDELPVVFEEMVREKYNETINLYRDPIKTVKYAISNVVNNVFYSQNNLSNIFGNCEKPKVDEHAEDVPLNFRVVGDMNVDDYDNVYALLNDFVDNVMLRVEQMKTKIQGIHMNIKLMNTFSKYVTQPLRTELCFMHEITNGIIVNDFVVRVIYPKSYELFSDKYVFISSYTGAIDYVKGFAKELTKRNLSVPNNKEFFRVLVDNIGRLPSSGKLTYSIPPDRVYFDDKFQPPSPSHDIVSGINSVKLLNLYEKGNNDMAINPLYNLFKLSSLAIERLMYSKDKNLQDKLHIKKDELERSFSQQIKRFKYSDFMTKKEFVGANAQYGFPKNTYS